jgi:hypothetical protein
MVGLSTSIRKIPDGLSGRDRAQEGLKKKTDADWLATALSGPTRLISNFNKQITI